MIALNPADISRTVQAPRLGQDPTPPTASPVSNWIVDPALVTTLYQNRVWIPWATGIAFVVVGGLLKLVPNPFEAKTFFHQRKMIAFGLGVGAGFAARAMIERAWQNQAGRMGPPAPKG